MSPAAIGAAACAAAMAAWWCAPAAPADVYSFVMVPILPPDEVDTVTDVHGPNRHGDFVISAIVNDTPFAYLWNDEVWTRIEVPGRPFVRVNGITDDLLIYGTCGPNANETAGFAWDAALRTAPEILPLRPTSASSQDDLVGNRIDSGGVAILPGVGEIVLPTLPGGGTTFASAVNERMENFTGPGNDALPYIVGRAIDAQGMGNAVLWIDGGDPHVLDRGEFYPTAVSDDCHVAGALISGSVATPCVWIRQTSPQPQWQRFDLPGEESIAAADINAASEMVGGKSLWVVDTAIVRVPLEAMTYIPKYVPLANGDFTSVTIEDYEVFGIADSGRMLGLARLDDDRLIPIKIIPHDRNNNEVPDYREVDLLSGVQHPEKGLIPPQILETRIGLHAPSRWLARASSQYDPANEVNEVHVVRFMTDHNRTHLLLNDPLVCAEFTNLITTWTNYERQNRENGAEIVYTERVNFTASWHPELLDNLDYIPPRDLPIRGSDELTQRQVLQNTKTFGRKYARFVDLFQLGNETFTKNGLYYFEDLHYEVNGEPRRFTGTMGDMPADALVTADQAMREWWRMRMDALLIGSALAGRPMQIVGSALPTEAVLVALPGDSYDFTNMEPNSSQQAGANRAAFAIRSAIEFCNEFGSIVDLHMHFFHYQHHLIQLTDAIENAPGRTAWPRPDLVACLEYGPAASHGWWYKQGNAAETAKFFDNDPETVPAAADTWDEWVEYWLANDTDLSLHETFLADGMDYMKALGYSHVCYSDTLQTSGGFDEAAPYDVSAIFPSKLDPEFGNMRATRWRRAFEEAAAPRGLRDFNPRPWRLPPFCLDIESDQR